MYFLNISGSCGGFAETPETEFVHLKDISIVNSFKIVLFYLFAEILVLNLPFCLWSRIDNQQAIQKIGLQVAKFDSAKVKSDHLCNFVIKYLNCHDSYVKIFLLTEFLNLAFSVGSFSFLFFYWKITPQDVFIFVFQSKCGKIYELFPSHVGCTYEQNSIVPELGNDFFETACFLNMNEVYSYIISGLYVWLLILIFWGVLNLIFRFMQICFRPMRAICLKKSAGFLSSNVNTNLLIEVLSFSDYFIIENLLRHVERDVFYDFCNSLLTELCSTVP